MTTSELPQVGRMLWFVIWMLMAEINLHGGGDAFWSWVGAVCSVILAGAVLL